jgi:signal peptidase I
VNNEPTTSGPGGLPADEHQPPVFVADDLADATADESAEDVDAAGAPPGEQEPAKKPPSFFKELPILVLIAFGLALLIKTFFIQAFYIPSESMVPTLNIGDRVLVNKIIYKLRAPRRGEVIVFVGQRDTRPRSFWTKFRETITGGLGGAQPAEMDYIKRVIALPGETIQIDKSVVTITPKDGGKPFTLKEPYVATQKDLTPYGPYTVPEGSFFVLGDNRPNSSDSRTVIGPIKRSEIVGRAFVRIWPLSRFRGMGRPDYAMSGALVALYALVRRHRMRTSYGSRQKAA